jgi:hypothetical protein
MKLDLNHNHSWAPAPPWVDDIDDKLGYILRRMENIMATMEELKAAVQRNTDVDSGVVTMLQGLSQQLKDAQAANDPVAVQAVIDQLDANTKTLSDAVTANTPVATPPAA